jgi:peptidoglycan/xylan/chitin deacetylase (PgdA/CDA1 family)
MKKYFIIALFLKIAVLCWPGVSLADTSLNGRWLDYYDEGDSLRQDGGVLINTRKPLERAGGYIKTGFWTWNLKDSVVSFRVKVSDWSKAKIVTLIVGNGLKFENAATFDIRRRFINAPNNEWVEVVIPQSAWAAEGNIDWENIDSVLFSVMDNGDDRITAQIANIKVVPVSKAQGVVSITFDDGMTDTMAGASIMQQYGYAGTAFIDVLQIGNKGFITEGDVAQLNRNGWDISGHNMGNLTKMSDDRLITHVHKTHEYLTDRRTKGSNLYALPNGARSAKVVNALHELFPYVFNIDGMANDPKYLINTNINRHSIDKHTPLSLAKKWVDDAKANGEWVIINFHTFSDDWSKEEDWSVADFTALLEYIKQQEIPVKPVSEALK